MVVLNAHALVFGCNFNSHRSVGGKEHNGLAGDQAQKRRGGGRRVAGIVGKEICRPRMATSTVADNKSIRR